MKHQYIERETGLVRDENLYHDRLINRIYSTARENRSFIFRLLTSRRMSGLLAFVNYDLPMGTALTGGASFLKNSDIDISEFCDPLSSLDTARKFFERRIRYWECRPLNDKPDAVVSPADSRMIIGSFNDTSMLFLKEKFFSFSELLGEDSPWLDKFSDGEYAIFRLTPEKYHYSHVPVSGTVADIYEIEGRFNSCNPAAVVAIDRAYSKNRRMVTVIDTDVPGGSGAGMVVMIEVVALMIGDIRQCYSEREYRSPVDIAPGIFLKKGQPKSLFRPGSSVDILIFEKGRIKFSPDLVENSMKQGIQSRFTSHFRRPLVETDVRVRSEIGRAVKPERGSSSV